MNDEQEMYNNRSVDTSEGSEQMWRMVCLTGPGDRG